MAQGVNPVKTHHKHTAHLLPSSLYSLKIQLNGFPAKHKWVSHSISVLIGSGPLNIQHGALL